MTIINNNYNKWQMTLIICEIQEETERESANLAVRIPGVSL